MADEKKELTKEEKEAKKEARKAKKEQVEMVASALLGLIETANENLAKYENTTLTLKDIIKFFVAEEEKAEKKEAVAKVKTKTDKKKKAINSL